MVQKTNVGPRWGDLTRSARLVSQMKVENSIECYVAPWALTGEELPIHIIINQQFKFDKIEIDIPSDLSLCEFHNVRRHSVHENRVIIEELHSRNYFGFVVAHNTLFDEITCEQKIIVRFMRKRKTIQELPILTKFFRPQISSETMTDSVVITNESDFANLLNLKIKVTGFGRIKIVLEVKADYDMKVVMESLFRNLIKQAVAKYSEQEEILPESEMFSDPNRILRAADNAFHYAGMPDELREKNLKDFQEFLTNTKNSGKILEDISKALETLLFEMLLFQFDKYPVEGVELRYGKPSLFASKFGKAMIIRIRYWDSMNNEYAPLEIPFKIDDQRTKKDPAEIPINIDWIREPFRIWSGDDNSE